LEVTTETVAFIFLSAQFGVCDIKTPFFIGLIDMTNFNRKSYFDLANDTHYEAAMEAIRNLPVAKKRPDALKGRFYLYGNIPTFAGRGHRTRIQTWRDLLIVLKFYKDNITSGQNPYYQQYDVTSVMNYVGRENYEKQFYLNRLKEWKKNVVSEDLD
jgi:hypothetical protein|tara:strand:- start:395 stop:865 length:471 start_codon:yes stop_codon:yes gene_type:complete